jgi:YHS domain-containing protein
MLAGWILKIILVLIIARLVWRFVRGVLEGAGMLAGPEKPSVKLVRDPVCGVFVVPSQALTARSGSTTAYFCSEKCRKAWGGP